MSSCSFPSSSAWTRQRPRNTVLTVLYISLATLSFFVGVSEAVSTPIRLPASLEYQGRSNACPARCAKSGPNPGNWSMYHNFAQFDSCQESLFYSFSLIDPVDNPDPFHHIYACTSFGRIGGTYQRTHRVRSQRQQPSIARMSHIRSQPGPPLRAQQSPQLSLLLSTSSACISPMDSVP